MCYFYFKHAIKIYLILKIYLLTKFTKLNFLKSYSAKRINFCFYYSMSSLLKKIYSKKIKAGSIFYALVLSLLVGMISTAMITLTFSNRFLDQKNDLREQLQRNAASGIQLLLSTGKNKGTPTVMDLFGIGLDSVFLEKKEWGVFSVGLSTAFQETSSGLQIHQEVVQLGALPSDENHSALYLEDHNKPLVVTGETYIKGLSYLPETGVKPGAINGISYSGDKLIHGTIRKSEAYLKALDKNSIQSLIQHFDLSATHDIRDSITQSFAQEAIVIRDSVLFFENQILKGQVIIVADSLIYIGKNAQIEDALFFAPYLFIEDGFSGNLQAFATKLIEVGKSVRLKYPSVLGLMKIQNNKKEPAMNIGMSSHIKGLVFIHNHYENKKHPRLKINKNTLIDGQVFAECPVELQGDVFGNISCKSFFLRYGASSYSNYLLDVEINYSKRSPYYLSPFINAAADSKVGIVKYLK